MKPSANSQISETPAPDHARVSDTFSIPVQECCDGWSLPGEFYSKLEIYQADLDRIWKRGWLFLGHSCEIPQPGDYFTCEVDTDPLVVVRADDGSIHTLHNVCRHRGSIICTEPAGHVNRLVCPYHQWVYGLDGRLLACRGMQSDLDKTAFSLGPVATREVEGLIFANLSGEPTPFQPAAECLGPLLKPQGLKNAKVAKAVNYVVEANWKLVWENNRECYHCNSNHPQYIKANFDHFNSDDITPTVRQNLDRIVSDNEKKWAASGLSPTHKEAGMTFFPDAEKNIWFSANRTPLADEWVSESIDGRQVAPLMGEYRGPDVGTLRVRSLPNFWNHSSCDHSVSTRLLPAGPQRTAVRVWWLVDKDAVEGLDYDLARLIPFWQLTSEQDWLICARQQKGVNSTAYRPGPYSTFKEYNVNAFVRWYLGKLRQSG